MEFGYVVIGLIVIGLVYFMVKGEKTESPSVKASTPAPAPAPVADANGNGITSKAELKKLTKNQLIDYAEKNSLKIKKSGTKAAVINEIHSQLK